MTLELVTGYAGRAHVSSADAGAFNIGLVGSKNKAYILDGCEASYAGNVLTIGPGNIVVDGRHVRITENEMLTVETGAAAATWYAKLHYTANSGTGVEDISFEVSRTATESGRITNGVSSATYNIYSISVGTTAISGVTRLCGMLKGIDAYASADLNVGGARNPMCIVNGEPKASIASIGGPARPVYMDNGTITAIDVTAGAQSSSSLVPAIVQNGEMKSASATNIGTANPVLVAVEAGAIKKSAQTKGSASNPVYLSNGTFVEGNEIPDGSTMVKSSSANIGTSTPVLFALGNRELKPASLNVGSVYKPIYVVKDASGNSTFAVATNVVSTDATGGNAGGGTKLLSMSGYKISESAMSVGGSKKPVYLNNGAITAASESVGSTTKPVYMNGGTITELGNDIGDINKPIYMQGGALKAVSANAGSNTRHMYMSSGALLSSTANKGSSARPIYMSNGEFTEASGEIGAFNKPIFMKSGTLQAGTTGNNVGSDYKPIYMLNGTLTAASETVGGTKKPVYMNKGTITACSETVGGPKQPVYMNSGTVTASTANVGSESNPVYMKDGVLTAAGGEFVTSASSNIGTSTPYLLAQSGRKIQQSTLSVGSSSKPVYLSSGKFVEGNAYGKTTLFSGSDWAVGSSKTIADIGKYDVFVCRMHASAVDDIAMIGVKFGSTIRFHAVGQESSSSTPWLLDAKMTISGTSVKLDRCNALNLWTDKASSFPVFYLYGIV